GQRGQETDVLGLPGGIIRDDKTGPPVGRWGANRGKPRALRRGGSGSATAFPCTPAGWSRGFLAGGRGFISGGNPRRKWQKIEPEGCPRRFSRIKTGKHPAFIARPLSLSRKTEVPAHEAATDRRNSPTSGQGACSILAGHCQKTMPAFLKKG